MSSISSARQERQLPTKLQQSCPNSSKHACAAGANQLQAPSTGGSLRCTNGPAPHIRNFKPQRAGIQDLHRPHSSDQLLRVLVRYINNRKTKLDPLPCKRDVDSLCKALRNRTWEASLSVLARLASPVEAAQEFQICRDAKTPYRSHQSTSPAKLSAPREPFAACLNSPS